VLCNNPPVGHCFNVAANQLFLEQLKNATNITVAGNLTEVARGTVGRLFAANVTSLHHEL
jgi:hypothetical protein